MRRERYHGRFENGGRRCEVPGCLEPGEFRAPGARPPGFDGPGDYRWFCLEHVRAFNAAYDWFEGMTMDEILEAQGPLSGWQSQTRAFHADAGSHAGPRWADFTDPLDAIAARAQGIRNRAQASTGLRFTASEQAALAVMGLDHNVDRPALRRRYSELVRRYHPDHNGGDRSHEARLRKVVEAYQLLRRSAPLA